MAIRIHESLPRNGKKLIPADCEGKVFVVEIPLDILYFLCPLTLCWNSVRGLAGGPLLTTGFFRVERGKLVIQIPHASDGWPGGRKAYVQRGLREDFESDAVTLEILYV